VFELGDVLVEEIDAVEEDVGWRHGAAKEWETEETERVSCRLVDELKAQIMREATENATERPRNSNK
jgi:hypothetical protein